MRKINSAFYHFPTNCYEILVAQRVFTKRCQCLLLLPVCISSDIICHNFMFWSSCNITFCSFVLWYSLFWLLPAYCWGYLDTYCLLCFSCQQECKNANDLSLHLDQMSSSLTWQMIWHHQNLALFLLFVSVCFLPHHQIFQFLFLLWPALSALAVHLLDVKFWLSSQERLLQ